jgi:hypothetical protein
MEQTRYDTRADALAEAIRRSALTGSMHGVQRIVDDNTPRWIVVLKTNLGRAGVRGSSLL